MFAFITSILCYIGLLTSCPVEEPRVDDGEFKSSVEIIEDVEKEVIPTKKSSKISQASWDRAIELRPIFKQVAEEEFENSELWLGVLVSLSHQESRHKTNTCSPAAACGNMQFISQTAKAMAATDCRDLGKPDRSDPNWAIRCGARLLKQNIKIVKVESNVCNILGIGAIRPYNEGVGWSIRARNKAENPNDINSVADVSIKHPSHELETDRYVVGILAKWFPEYMRSNYFDSPDYCQNYTFDTHGLDI